VTGFVYLFHSPTEDLTKIGMALDYRARLTELHRRSVPLRVLGAFRSAKFKYHERVLHKRFAAKRVRGEWFALNDSDIDAIGRYFGRKDGWRDRVPVEPSYWLYHEEQCQRCANVFRTKPESPVRCPACQSCDWRTRKVFPCGHLWIPSPRPAGHGVDSPPKVCMSCKSTKWNEPKKSSRRVE